MAELKRSFPRTAFYAAGGLLIWAADFLFIYAFAAVACARGYVDTTVLGVGIVPLASVVATVIAAVATAAIFLSGGREARPAQEDAANGGVLSGVAAIAALLALIAIAFTALPGLLLQT
jgi:hypothetical protein